MAAAQCFLCWLPGLRITGLDEPKSSGTLWSEVDFAHCQGTQPEDFRSPGGPFLCFPPPKKSCQVAMLKGFLTACGI